jgi:hypothetical protein
MAKRPETLLQKLTRQAQQVGIKRMTDQSQRWFTDKVRLLAAPSTFDRIRSDQKNRGMALERNPGIGFMYTFNYFAKHDKKLPYWDKFPLIFVIERYENGFLGINLHYLSPKYRAVLLSKLMELASNDTLNNKTKLEVSYGILAGAARYKEFRPCIKRYLYTQLRSQMLKIPSQEWEPAVFLPLASFVRASNSKVWSDSAQIIQGKKK